MQGKMKKKRFFFVCYLFCFFYKKTLRKWPSFVQYSLDLLNFFVCSKCSTLQDDAFWDRFMILIRSKFFSLFNQSYQWNWMNENHKFESVNLQFWFFNWQNLDCIIKSHSITTICRNIITDISSNTCSFLNIQYYRNPTWKTINFDLW